MIDTIILSLPRSKVREFKPYTHEVEDWNLQARTNTYDKFVKNPSKRDKESGLYFPRLTGIRRAEGKQDWESTTYIEFSAPKLLYKNNLDELEEGDFERLLKTLGERLILMGVIVPTEVLREASVKAIHYSRNVRLCNGYTAQFVIRELGKINANKRFDLAQFRYINDGQSLQIYTKAHSFVIYDKIADLKKGKRRAIDKDQIPEQTTLFAEYRQDDILRLEVRLSEKRKLNALFKKLGFTQHPTFRDAFSLEKSQKVLEHYWGTLIAGHSLSIFSHGSNPKDLLAQVLIARRGTKAKTAIYLTGLIFLARDENGLRELRTMLSRHIDDRSWHRLAANLREIATDLEKLRPREWYGQVERALKTYQPLRLACKQ